MTDSLEIIIYHFSTIFTSQLPYPFLGLYQHKIQSSLWSLDKFTHNVSPGNPVPRWNRNVVHVSGVRVGISQMTIICSSLSIIYHDPSGVV